MAIKYLKKLFCKTGVTQRLESFDFAGGLTLGLFVYLLSFSVQYFGPWGLELSVLTFVVGLFIGPFFLWIGYMRIPLHRERKALSSEFQQESNVFYYSLITGTDEMGSALAAFVFKMITSGSNSNYGSLGVILLTVSTHLIWVIARKRSLAIMPNDKRPKLKPVPSSAK